MHRPSVDNVFDKVRGNYRAWDYNKIQRSEFIHWQYRDSNSCTAEDNGIEHMIVTNPQRRLSRTGLSRRRGSREITAVRHEPIQMLETRVRDVWFDL